MYKVRGVFRTLSNIYDRAFCCYSKAVNHYFCKMLYKYSTSFWIHYEGDSQWLQQWLHSKFLAVHPLPCTVKFDLHWLLVEAIVKLIPNEEMNEWKICYSTLLQPFSSQISKILSHVNLLQITDHSPPKKDSCTTWPQSQHSKMNCRNESFAVKKKKINK